MFLRTNVTYSVDFPTWYTVVEYNTGISIAYQFAECLFLRLFTETSTKNENVEHVNDVNSCSLRPVFLPCSAK